MASKKVLSPADIVESHKPKNFKYKYLFHDDEFLMKLEADGYDIDSLDTIRNDALVQESLKCELEQHDRETVSHAKEPTKLQDGVMLSKRMITKADKKLQSVNTGFFTYQQSRYMIIKFQYEKFDIVEIFMIT